MNCRFCNHQLSHQFLDLGHAPPSNSFLTKNQLKKPEIYYPLKLYICEKCWLVQVEDHINASEIFTNNYIYFSSFSKSWLNHAKQYVEMITKKLCLNEHSSVIEIASNDGYLLQYFHEKKIPCLGIEPTKDTAQKAIEKGIPVIEEFFGETLSEQLRNQGKTADLVIGNNVLAHVPDINNFVKALKNILKENGVITLEFPHLLKLIEGNQFDTIYHEHFSYLSFHTVRTIFLHHHLEIFEVEELKTHGGSLRVYAKHKDNNFWPVKESVKNLERKELNHNMLTLNYYYKFQEKVTQIKNNFLLFLIQQKQKKKSTFAYGAAAKGNTLFNYCGVKKDLITCVVDASPYKQEKYLPCSHIPVVSEKAIIDEKPDYILILPWNIKTEIVNQLHYIKKWNGKFVVTIPELNIFEEVK